MGVGEEMNKIEFIKQNLANTTMLKKRNFLLCCTQYLLKSRKVLGYPMKLVIDPTTICNLKCEFCPTGRNAEGRTKMRMPFKLYKKILDEVGNYLVNISLYNWGEPLLNKDIFGMIRYAKEYGIKVTISSNLNYFSDKICKELVDSGLDWLIVSLDGASQKTAVKYQKGVDYLKTIENISKIIEYKKKKNSKTPYVRWRFIVNKYNENEIKEAEEIRKTLGIDELELGKFRCEMDKEVFMNNEQQYENAKIWLPEDENLSMYNYKKKGKKLRKKDCKYLWTEATINPDGRVSPCCSIYDEKFDFGDVSKTSFYEIWNNKLYQEARAISRGDNIKNNSVCYLCKLNNAETY